MTAKKNPNRKSFWDDLVPSSSEGEYTATPPPEGPDANWLKCTLNSIATFKKLPIKVKSAFDHTKEEVAGWPLKNLPIHETDWFKEEEVQRWLDEFGWKDVVRAFERFCGDKGLWGDNPLRNFKHYVLKFCKEEASWIESAAYAAGKLGEARMKELGLGAYNPKGRKTMIIVASRRTDIPALYETWFLNRLNAGYCKVRRREGEPATVSLKREDVDGFVFWTKNIGPFMGALHLTRLFRFAFYIHYTINNYDKDLEPHSPPAADSIKNMRELRRIYGSEVAVWRYDPIVITREMTTDWHLGNFTRLAEALRGSTNEVVVSFLDVNRYNVRSRMGPGWSDLSTDQKKLMVSDLGAIARNNDMKLKICCQRDVLAEGVLPARCVDADRLMRITRAAIHSQPKPCRAGCNCSAYEDIGDWDTCAYGCRYCDATGTAALARSHYLARDPHGETLIPLVKGSNTERERAKLIVPDLRPGEQSPVRGDRYWARRPIGEHVSREPNEVQICHP
jgi:hypothetical protein